MNLLSRQHPHPLYLLLIFMLASFAMLTWLSLARYFAFTSRAFDLGAMSQAIWSVTQGEPLIFTVEGITLSRLARHVELFYFLLTPIYALWPAPSTLLILQAGLAVFGALPLYNIANRRLRHAWSALIIAAIYLLYPVMQTAVLFEFHADTLAMPLLLFALDSLDRQDRRSTFIWLVLALSCKFYVAVPVAALGVIIWWAGKRQLGWATFILAAVWGGVTFGVLRPLFVPSDAIVEATSISYLSFYFSQLNLALTGILRASNAIIVYAPVLLLAWRAPRWLLPATAVIFTVLLSSGPGPSFDYQYHHYALGVPFLMMALVEGAEKLGQNENTSHPWQKRLGMAFLFTLLLNSLLVNTPLNFRFYQAQPGSGFGLETQAGYGQTARDEFKFDWMAPLQASKQPLAADRSLARLATNRSVLYLVPPENKPHEELLPQVETVAVDALYDFALLDRSQNLLEGGVQTVFPTIRWLLNQRDWHLVRAQDGLLEFGRQDVGLWQQVTVQPAANHEEAMAHFGDELALLNADVVSLGGGLFRLDFFWRAERPFPEKVTYFAVSRLDGLPQSRVVHLPTLAMMPVSMWTPNTTIHESFVFALPANAPAGRYAVKTGWYNADLPWAAETDNRSRLGEEITIGYVVIP